jgi:hypothetical protein
MVEKRLLTNKNNNLYHQTKKNKEPKALILHFLNVDQIQGSDAVRKEV